MYILWIKVHGEHSTRLECSNATIALEVLSEHTATLTNPRYIAFAIYQSGRLPLLVRTTDYRL